MATILIIDGSLGGSTGNTAELLAVAEDRFRLDANVNYLELCREPGLQRILKLVEESDAFLFGTGTYWDSWGSPMQRFLEMTAHTEAQKLWVGKPAGAIVTAHAFGGKGVLSRLFGVLNIYGMLLPPHAGMVYTFAGHVAQQLAPEHLRNELWKTTDVSVVCDNILEALLGGKHWKTWSTNNGRSGEKWLDSYSVLADREESSKM